MGAMSAIVDGGSDVKKPNYRVITFTARLRGYNAKDWPNNVPDACLFLFDKQGQTLGYHYREHGRWYGRGLFQIAGDYSLTEDTDIGYVLDMSEVVMAAMSAIVDGGNDDVLP